MQQENTGAQRPQEEEYLFQLAKLEVRIRAMSAQEKEKYADKIAEVQKHLARLTPAQRQAVAGHMARMQGAQAQPPVQAQPPAQGETPAQSQAAATPSEGPMEKQAAAPRPGEWEEEEEEEDVPVKTKKAKKKKRKGPGCLVAVIAVFLVLVAAASFGISWYFNEINGNRGQNSYTATVTIEQGSGPLTIGRALQQQGIIRSAQIFRLYVRQQGVADTLQYGTFELSSAMSYDEIITALQQTQDDRETVRVTFPEGITATQFAARMEEAGLCTADEFLDVANNADFSQFEFWAHRDEDPAQFMKSEGYLFPDTYDFFVGDDVYNMVARIYQEFNTKYLENDLQGKAEAMGFTLTQYVTLASLVQEEAGGAEHQADVAAIFMNRMAEGSPVPRLESNTSSYIQNDNDNNYLNNTVAKVLGGWENIPQEVIDGYDTYSREGLPVGPISNPGLDALLNTTRYAESQYYGNGYYFSHPLEVFAFNQGGMSFHGGLVGALLSGIVAARLTGIPYLTLADLGCIGAPLGLLFGRCANFINGELWGAPTDAPWGVVFGGAAGTMARHPSQLYEALLEGVVIFAALYLLSRRLPPRPRGTFLGLFLVMYGCFRFLVEFVREPDVQLGYLWGGWLTMGQLLSAPLVAVGAGVLVYALVVKKPQQGLPEMQCKE